MLNEPIKFLNNSSATCFRNPVAIEALLHDFFSNRSNVTIVLFADTCREPNKFKEVFKELSYKFPFNIPNNFTFKGEESKEQKNKPPVNHMFVRFYACQQDGVTDAKSTF